MSIKSKIVPRKSKIRGGRRLPDDCIICAAANYKLNLPGWCDIMAPELNRFCIINLQSTNDLDVIDEFTQDFTEVDDEWPEIPNIEPTKTSDTKVLNLMNKFFHGLWKKYPRDLSSKVGQTIGALNLNNQRFDGMYSDNDTGVGQVLNFISGRNMSYICRAFKALYSVRKHSPQRGFGALQISRPRAIPCRLIRIQWSSGRTLYRSNSTLTGSVWSVRPSRLVTLLT